MDSTQISYFGRTDVGIVRDHNEDAFGCFLPGGQSAGDSGATAEGGDLIAVLSDGVGGHECGQLASNSTVAAVGALLGQLALASENLEVGCFRERIETAMAGQNRNPRSVARIGAGQQLRRRCHGCLVGCRSIGDGPCWRYSTLSLARGRTCATVCRRYACGACDCPWAASEQEARRTLTGMCCREPRALQVSLQRQWR